MPDLSFFSFCLCITLGDKTFGLVLCNSRTSVGTRQGKSQGLPYFKGVSQLRAGRPPKLQKLRSLALLQNVGAIH
jgi:hypothetical protein